MPKTPVRRPAHPHAALRHLRKADARLAKVIDAVGPLPPHSIEDPDDHFGSLVRIIVGQQLSVTAASAIYKRLTSLFKGGLPTPRALLKCDIEVMRTTAGLSRPKASYLHSLAGQVVSGEVDFRQIDTLSDEDAAALIMKVRGMGEWSAHMFLMFHLDRPDVLATGDLGIRKAVQRLYKLETLPLPPEIEGLAAPWRPHRTLACRYLWRSLDSKMPLD